MAFNEDTRVKIPAILHLCRLGYEYVSLKNAKYDIETNIFTDIFYESIKNVNSGIEDEQIKRELEKISLALDNEDLGKEFYEKLLSNDIKLIDFQNFENNTFNVVTELPCKNGDDEFRPDITLLINGMPLAFIEVKKPNNKEGILAERNRINIRFQNKKFRKFINISQILVFSNNMEYDSESIDQIQGAFYSSSSYKKANFNVFKEDEKVEKLDLSKILKSENEEIENFVLKDNNLSSIKHSPEFITNKNADTPTNRISTSLFSKERLSMLLQYCIAYVKESKGLEKHIMRYQQFFATKAIEQTIDKDIKKGIIWHTQGSGKTALAFYNVNYLTDYFQEKKIIPKFYFIVDRLDLLIQAKREFTARGLVAHTVNSKNELLADFKSKKIIHNLKGNQEVTVVNIQKFKEDDKVLSQKSYNTNTQRIYFLDEVHRSYDPKGSFLANLMTSDRDAIIIGLTGTPLIGDKRRSKDIFGDYIHKYYYNSSIADGYTLKLIREGIESNYRLKLEETLREIKILKGDISKKDIYSHQKFVEPMLEYIVDDFQKSRIMHGDNTIGGMVVCDSADQARMMSKLFAEKYSDKLKAYFDVMGNYALNSRDGASIINDGDGLGGALILHDSGNKDERKQAIEDFKAGNIDFLFVYNMLLTGFDAKRLKKLYIGRVIKNHNLLQTLTRVNRPYKNFRYGYVVDFADIRQEFEVTNKAYFEELQDELGDEMDTYSNLFMSKEDIEAEIENIKEKLFHFDLKNSETFSQQITAIEDKKRVLEIKKAFGNVRNLYNIIRLQGNYELLDKIDFKKLSSLYNEVSNHLNMLNFKESLEKDSTSTNLVNVALEDIIFKFIKVSEEELVIADKLKDSLKKAREELAKNFDPQDPEFISLYEELKRLFEKKNLDEITQEEMTKNIHALNQIYDSITDLNRRNNLLKTKYNHDEKYARLHKRVLEKKDITTRESIIYDVLSKIKTEADEKVLTNNKMLNNENYFNNFMQPLVITGFEENEIKLDPQSAKYINGYVVKEYLNEFNNNLVYAK
ncbi:MAG: DEAD/DEAH box helicase family protein [Patescibacteria group bacterium]|nr:DEAD/DEAH box helicase family protein [Patescibacteria group bacterium]